MKRSLIAVVVVVVVGLALGAGVTKVGARLGELHAQGNPEYLGNIQCPGSGPLQTQIMAYHPNIDKYIGQVKASDGLWYSAVLPGACVFYSPHNTSVPAVPDVEDYIVWHEYGSIP